MQNLLSLHPSVVCDVLGKPESELNAIEQALANAIKAGRSEGEIVAIREEAEIARLLPENPKKVVAIPIRL